ncbi:MAG TPA: hypothetical protein VJ770_08140 [Stellaceae bacterium]|nr:hypothetical protein [Stellaceae bacterium]
MGEIVKFPQARMRRIRERIRDIRKRHATGSPENRLYELDERLRTIDNAIAGLQENRRVVMVEWHDAFRRVQAAERRRQIKEPGQ